jgi:Carboxypeptidase regulatory-like domain/TonB dependent receptor-like, beta-barrel
MPRHLPILLALCACAAVPAQSQTLVRASNTTSTLSTGQIRGVVRDDAGAAIGGVAVIAVGRTLAAARSDAGGRFRMALPAGEYVLRASRAGYVSTYREAVRVRTAVPVERTITLKRDAAAATARRILTAGAGLAPPVPTLATDDPATEDGHSEAAWRLRHLPRTVLRQTSPDGIWGTGGQGAFPPRIPAAALAGARPSPGSAALFADSSLSGQVNFLTTSALGSATGWLPGQVPRGVAYIAVRAPVSSYGEWSVRGAMNASDLSSWVVVGEFRARPDQPHMFAVGMSRSVQMFTTEGASLPMTSTSTRSVGGIYGSDHWQVSRALEIDYGLRLDRYDYVDTSGLWSPRLAARLAVLPRTYLSLLASQQMIAPGAGEFLPPQTAAVWLPPERTFSPLVAGAPFQAETVRNYRIGLEREFGRTGHTRTVSIVRFHQAVTDQGATLFGLDKASDFGHYYVATPGNVAVDGWNLRVSGALGAGVQGSVTYSTGLALWTDLGDAGAAAERVPSVLRAPRERLHDLTASLETSVPGLSTHVALAYRLDSAFSHDGASGRLPILDGRFDMQVRQALPYEPIRGSQLELLFAVRNLFHGLREPGSIYDELLTVSPPLRLMGGLQVRF